MPTTSYPSDFNSAAVADESTPPDMATTILVSCGRPSRSKLLSMAPVIDAIAAALDAFAIWKPPCDWKDAMRLQSLAAIPDKRTRFIGAPEKLLFNIGRIPVRQSRQPVLRPHKRQILPPGRKGIPFDGSVVYRIYT